MKSNLLFYQYATIASVVTLYWFVSIFMIFLNKLLVGGASMEDKDAPLFVTAVQCVVTALSCLALSSISKFTPKIIAFPKLGWLEPYKIHSVFPLTCVFVMMMTMNNLCLKYVGVAFYYVGRSLTTVCNVIFTFFILGEKTSMPALVCCSVIIGGFWLGVDQEGEAGSLSIVGVFYGVLASAAVSLNAIFTKKVLPSLNGCLWTLSYYNNVIASLLFVPLMVVCGEVPAVVRIVAENDLKYWLLLALSGLFGFAIGFVTGLQIKVTSPLTHNVSGTAKACCQTIMATWWYAESRSLLWWASNLVVLGGSLGYSRVKQIQMASKFRHTPIPISAKTTS